MVLMVGVLCVAGGLDMKHKRNWQFHSTVDLMQDKIGELEKSVMSLTATVEQDSSGSVDDYHGAHHQQRHRINQE